MFKCMTEISEIFSGELVYANWAFSKSLPKKVSIQKSLYLQLYLCTNFSVLYKLTHSIVNELWNVNRNTAFCCVYEWMKKFHWLTQPTVSVTISTKVLIEWDRNTYLSNKIQIRSLQFQVKLHHEGRVTFPLIKHQKMIDFHSRWMKQLSIPIIKLIEGNFMYLKC